MKCCDDHRQLLNALHGRDEGGLIDVLPSDSRPQAKVSDRTRYPPREPVMRHVNGDPENPGWLQLRILMLKNLLRWKDKIEGAPVGDITVILDAQDAAS